MYMFIYKEKTAERNRNDNLSIVLSRKDGWKDDRTLGESDLDTLKLFKKALSNLSLNESIRLMYLVYGDDQILLDMFDNVQRVDFGQTSPDCEGSNSQDAS